MSFHGAFMECSMVDSWSAQWGKGREEEGKGTQRDAEVSCGVRYYSSEEESHARTRARFVDLPGFVAHFRHRVLQDALAEATGAYWLRRAQAFAAVGTPTCDVIARNCRVHATLVPFPADQALAEVILRETP